ncbi:hypothetical protein ANANG_G00252470 [Anguilla anguilla]|uniref:HMG box domain-containing protein n=1 Tax=Anguilla anguilla TaxID=7936 RepID=A0A9D3LSN1_ANGAN|nr:hypothetical protein ANANG_G00252470 [Anguilla anguilla]
MALLRSISLPQLQKKRPRRPRLDTCDGAELKEGQGEGCGEPMDCDAKLEAPGSPDGGGGPEGGAEGGADGEGAKGGGPEEEMDDKKKKRKPYRPGIGGFMVRQRKCNLLLKRGRILPPTTREGVAEGMGGAEGLAPDRTTDEVVCSRAQPEASQDAKLTEAEAEHAKSAGARRGASWRTCSPRTCRCAFSGRRCWTSVRGRFRPLRDRGPHRALPHPAPHSPSHTGPGGQTHTPPNSGCRGGGRGFPAPLKQEAGASQPREGTEGPPNEAESQDSEQFFRKVLGSSDSTSLGGTLQAGMRPILGGPTKSLPPGSSLSGVLPSTGLMDSFPGLCQSPFFDRGDRAGLFSPDHEDESFWDPPSTPATPSTPTTPTEPEGDGLSYNQRSLQRWEKDEELGHLSTISPVLYANVNFPSLKQDYPDWSSRCKQIMKVWRKISAAEKAPFLQKAKDNRASQRVSKAQKLEEKSQVCRTVKTEPGSCDGPRPALHLQIRPPGLTPDPSQPGSAESPVPRPRGGPPRLPRRVPAARETPQADPFPRAQHPHFQEPSGPRGSPQARGPVEPRLLSPPRGGAGPDLGSGSRPGRSARGGAVQGPPTPWAHQGTPPAATRPPRLGTLPTPTASLPAALCRTLTPSRPSPSPPVRGGCSPSPSRTPAPGCPAVPSPSLGALPLTPGALSSEAFSAQSPAASRFQSPEPCSRPPSRPQSRDPLAARSSPAARPPVPRTEARPSRALPAKASRPRPTSSPSVLPGTPLWEAAWVPRFEPEPRLGRVPGNRPQLCSPAQAQAQAQAQIQHLQPQAQPAAAHNFPSRTQLPPGAPDAPSPWPREPQQGPGRPPQELPDLAGPQDPALIGLSQAELEKHRQRLRLRELLIRHQMQRNSLRQEKEAAAANSGAANWPGGETAPYQLDKTLRPPPPYPQDKAAVGHPGAASMEDKLGHPPPPRMPVNVDPSAVRLQGSQNLQGFHPQPRFPAPWPGQQAGLQRFPQPPAQGRAARDLSPAFP